MILNNRFANKDLTDFDPQEFGDRLSEADETKCQECNESYSKTLKKDNSSVHQLPEVVFFSNI